MKLKTILLLITYCLLLTTFLGCEAFRRKFVRKPKKEKEIRVVVEPKEYHQLYSAQQRYQNYFSFWKAAQKELLNSLDLEDINRKARRRSVSRIVDNLERMRQMLPAEKQEKIDRYIQEQNDIGKMLDRYKISRAQKLCIRSILKRQSREIQTEFSYEQVKEYLPPR